MRAAPFVPMHVRKAEAACRAAAWLIASRSEKDLIFTAEVRLKADATEKSVLCVYAALRRDFGSVRLQPDATAASAAPYGSAKTNNDKPAAAAMYCLPLTA